MCSQRTDWSGFRLPRARGSSEATRRLALQPRNPGNPRWRSQPPTCNRLIRAARRGPSEHVLLCVLEHCQSDVRDSPVLQICRAHYFVPEEVTLLVRSHNPSAAVVFDFDARRNLIFVIEILAPPAPWPARGDVGRQYHRRFAAQPASDAWQTAEESS